MLNGPGISRTERLFLYKEPVGGMLKMPPGKSCSLALVKIISDNFAQVGPLCKKKPRILV